MTAIARRRQSLRCYGCAAVIEDPALSDEFCRKCSAFHAIHAASGKFRRDVPPPKRDLKDRVKRLEEKVTVLVETAAE
jgi:hypothetical protein